jgi:hypothetical protein
MVAETSVGQNGAPEHSGVQRRSVLAGAVWSLPVVAVAVSTPLAAASTGALGAFVIESTLGGTWVDAQYYGASIQLRNDDTDAATLPVEDITSGTVTVTFNREDVGAVEPAVIANAGGGSPTVGGLPATGPTWTAAGGHRQRRRNGDVPAHLRRKPGRSGRHECELRDPRVHAPALRHPDHRHLHRQSF